MKQPVVSRVLIYRDGGDYVARALELDLLGSGNSPNKALKDLEHAVRAQVSFALQKNAPDMIYFQADKECEKRWLDAARRGLQNLADGDVAIHCRATMIQVDAAVPTAGQRFRMESSPRELACAQA